MNISFRQERNRYHPEAIKVARLPDASQIGLRHYQTLKQARNAALESFAEPNKVLLPLENEQIPDDR